MNAKEFQADIEKELRAVIDQYDRQEIAYEKLQDRFGEINEWANYVAGQFPRKLKSARDAFQAAKEEAFQTVPIPRPRPEDAVRMGWVEEV
mgnify:CR=1 FL=1